MHTELLYMKNMEQMQCSSKIIASQKNEWKNILMLDQTIFYPQGGGQPYDIGMIKSIDRRQQRSNFALCQGAGNYKK